jgi:serine protease Do
MLCSLRLSVSSRCGAAVLLLASLGWAMPLRAELASKPAAPITHRVFYQLTETSHLLVRVRLNGRGPFNFIMDTGAPALILSREAAQKAGVASGKNGWGLFRTLEVEGGARLQNIPGRIEEPAQLRAMNALELAGVRLDGVLGYNVLAHFRIEIDLTQPTMRWTTLNYELPALTPISAKTTDGKSLAPPPDLAAMEGMANVSRVAGMFMPHRAAPVLRGFFGIELWGEKEDGSGRRINKRSSGRNGALGARVRTVLPQGPAAQAGLRAADRILRIQTPGLQAQTVRRAADVSRLLANVPPAALVKFSVARGRKIIMLNVRAAQGGL